MISLTKKERELMLYIQRVLRETGGVGPTFEEMMEHMGLASKSGIFRMITQLEHKGRLRRRHNQPRAIEILEPVPDESRLARAEAIVAALWKKGCILGTVPGVVPLTRAQALKIIADAL